MYFLGIETVWIQPHLKKSEIYNDGLGLDKIMCLQTHHNTASPLHIVAPQQSGKSYQRSLNFFFFTVCLWYLIVKSGSSAGL